MSSAQTNTVLATTSKKPMTLREMFLLAGVRDRFPFDEMIEVTPEGDPEKEPFKHQINGLNLALSYSRYGIYDEPSVGKTLIAQSYALYHAGLGNKVVVVMPPILLEQFKESFQETFNGFERYVNFHILREGPAKRAELFERWRETEWPDIMCMTYQMFAKLPRARKNKEGEIIQPPNPDDYISGVLKAAGYAVLVCDEAHALKNPESDTHKAVKHFLGDIDSSAFLPMTGTPSTNTAMDFYGLISLVTPDKYTSLKSFERQHCVYANDEDGREHLVAFKNLDLLSAALYSRARRITKDMVFSPKKPHIIEVPVTLDPTHHKLYKRLVTERFLEVKGEIIDATTAQSLRQKALKIVLNPQLFSDHPIRNEMLAMTDQLIDSVGIEHEKVLIFAHFQDTVKALAKYYAKYNPALVYGGAGNNNKEKDKFLKDPTCRMMIANAVSGGVGLNLQSVCGTAIFVEPTSVPGTFKQALERLRVGHPSQKRVVSIYILKAIGTIAPRLTRSMLGKEKDFLAVTRDRQSMLSELLGQ